LGIAVWYLELSPQAMVEHFVKGEVEELRMHPDEAIMRLGSADRPKP
jgi:hypothetical protein